MISRFKLDFLSQTSFKQILITSWKVTDNDGKISVALPEKVTPLSVGNSSMENIVHISPL